MSNRNIFYSYSCDFYVLRIVNQTKQIQSSGSFPFCKLIRNGSRKVAVVSKSKHVETRAGSCLLGINLLAEKHQNIEKRQQKHCNNCSKTEKEGFRIFIFNIYKSDMALNIIVQTLGLRVFMFIMKVINCWNL